MGNEVSGCTSCASDKVEFDSELCLHIPRANGLNKPHVFAFPKLTVCLTCGTIRGSASTEELQRLKDAAGAKEIAV